MRCRALVLIPLLSLVPELGAQTIRLPHGTQRTPETPVPLPPEVAPVSRSLAFQRSRWSAEGYSLVSAVLIPSSGGGVSRYNTFGTGTHADYRFTEGMSATIDLTVSPITSGNPMLNETAEVGMRYSPLSWDNQVRPFVDVRGVYMHMYDTYALSAGNDPGVGPGTLAYSTTGRYGRGVGAVGGAGIEYSITPRVALTNELSALRNRMTTYRLTNQPSVSAGGNYWMTSFRYMLGIKYTPVRALRSEQSSVR